MPLLSQGAGPRGPGMMGQRPPFGNQMEAARQQNLAKIEQLRQTLEAAQRQELQYVEVKEIQPSSISTVVVLSR